MITDPVLAYIAGRFVNFTYEEISQPKSWDAARFLPRREKMQDHCVLLPGVGGRTMSRGRLVKAEKLEAEDQRIEDES